MRRVKNAVALFAVMFATAAWIFGFAAMKANATVHTSPSGVALIQRFEGYFPARYADPVGVVTQCYGATGAELAALPAFATQAECVAQLRRSLTAHYEPAVARLFHVGGMLHGKFDQHRFDALVSAAYNLGVGAVQCAPGFETLCAALRAHDPRRVADALLRYDHAGGVPFLGLTLRRQAERAMFLRPMARFEMFTAAEKRWIERYDALAGHTSRAAKARRGELRAAMRAQAKRISTAAGHEHDWLTRRRATRYAALARRSR
jgi:lysozyme